MKKYILLLASAAFVISCQKYAAGGNKDALEKVDGVVSYSDEHAPKSTYVEKTDTAKSRTFVAAPVEMKTDSTEMVQPEVKK